MRKCLRLKTKDDLIFTVHPVSSECTNLISHVSWGVRGPFINKSVSLVVFNTLFFNIQGFQTKIKFDIRISYSYYWNKNLTNKDVYFYQKSFLYSF